MSPFLPFFVKLAYQIYLCQDSKNVLHFILNLSTPHHALRLPKIPKQNCSELLMTNAYIAHRNGNPERMFKRGSAEL